MSSTLINKTERDNIAVSVWTDKRVVYIKLTDERIIGFPADRFKILRKATEDQLKNVKLEVNGSALRWDNLDEDISVNGIVEGRFQLS